MFGPHRSARTVLAWRRGTALFIATIASHTLPGRPLCSPRRLQWQTKRSAASYGRTPHEIKALPHEPILNDVCFSEQAAPGMFTAVGFC